jgi:hypothetical protein
MFNFLWRWFGIKRTNEEVGKEIVKNWPPLEDKIEGQSVPPMQALIDRTRRERRRSAPTISNYIQGQPEPTTMLLPLSDTLSSPTKGHSTKEDK